MNELIGRLQAELRGWRTGTGHDAGDRAVLVGAVVSALWLVLVLLFWALGPTDAPQPGGLARLAATVAVILPLVLVWIAVGLARAIAELRAEAVLLRTRMEALRPAERAAAERDARLPEAPGRAATAALRPAPARAPAARPAEPRTNERQPDLPLDQPPPVRLAPADLVAALNFPDGPDDHAAIAALRTALGDPDTARGIRAAQDVVTLLAKHGLYMDDIAPIDADAPGWGAGWRRFLDGQRAGTQALAGIEDDDALAIATALMRSDEVFRDAAHHFLRQFDRILTRAAPGMDDRTLGAAADTRSGRAFRLLAQVTGMFG